MQTLANVDVQSADRIPCHFREERHVADRQLDNDGFERWIDMDGGDDAWEHIVEAQAGRCAGRQHDFARWNTHTDRRVRRDVASRREQYAAIERQLDESAIPMHRRRGRVEHAAQANRFTQPRQIRSR